MALKQISNIQSLHSITSKNGSGLVWIEGQSTFIHSGPTVQLLNIIHTNIQNIHISCEGSYSRIKATQNRKKRMQLAIKSSHTANCPLFKRIILNFGPTWPNSQLTNEPSVDQTGPRQESSRRTCPVTLHCTGLLDTPGAMDRLELSQLRMFKFSWSCREANHSWHYFSKSRRSSADSSWYPGSSSNRARVAAPHLSGSGQTRVLGPLAHPREQQLHGHPQMFSSQQRTRLNLENIVEI